MRIAIATYDFDPPIGGLGVHVMRLLTALKREHSNEYVVLSPSPNAESHLPQFVKNRWKKRGGSPLFSLALFFLFPRLLRREKIDLLHVHGGSGGVLLLRKPGIPVVVTCHHTYRDEADVYRQTSSVTYLRKMLMALIEKRTYRIADKIMCVSDGTLERLKKDYRVPAEKLVLVENAVNDELLLMDDRACEENLLLFAGRLEPRKGLPILLQAFASVKKKNPSLRLRIVGENMMGAAALDQHLRDASLSIRDIELVGFVTQQEYWNELKRATILVVPSLREGFGLVAAEGMAAGIPVVASDCDGLRHVIREGETGLLFKTGDADECARAVEKLLTDHDLRARLVTNGKDEAKVRFSVERQARETLACFNKTAEGKSAS